MNSPPRLTLLLVPLLTRVILWLLTSAVLAGRLRVLYVRTSKGASTVGRNGRIERDLHSEVRDRLMFPIQSELPLVVDQHRGRLLNPP